MYLTPTDEIVPPTRPATAQLLVCDLKTRCSHCHLRAWCLPSHPTDLHHGCGGTRDAWMFGRRQVRGGQTLYREGQALEYLFEVRSGHLKSSLATSDGRERVTAFHMSGDLLGLDGVATGVHASSVTALEDTEVCTVSYAYLTNLAKNDARLQRTLMQHMGREIVRELHLLVLLGSMSAEERLAKFLLGLSRRMSERGYSPSDFHIRMTRADIGSYLGLTLETISRTFTALQKLDFLDVNQRHIRITDMVGLAGRR